MLLKVLVHGHLGLTWGPVMRQSIMGEMCGETELLTFVVAGAGVTFVMESR